MVRYMAALSSDEDGCKTIMLTVMAHALPGRDTVLLTRVLPALKYDPAIILFDPPTIDEEQRKSEEEAKAKLQTYANQCLQAKLGVSILVLTGDHPGSALCKAAREQHIDCMIVGRREIGMFQRLLTSSTSKYCVSNADCNVLVVKQIYSPLQNFTEEDREKKQMSSEFPSVNVTPPGSTPSSSIGNNELKKPFSHLKVPVTPRNTPTTPAKQGHPLDWPHLCDEIKRIEAEEATEEAKERKEESQKDLEEVKQLEEQERAERIEQWREEDAKAKEQRNLERRNSLDKAHIAEEEERSYRIRFQDEEDRREEVLSRINSHEDWLRTKQMEEEERERRIREEQELKVRRIQESKHDLRFVKSLEEAERARRMHLHPLGK